VEKLLVLLPASMFSASGTISFCRSRIVRIRVHLLSRPPPSNYPLPGILSAALYHKFKTLSISDIAEPEIKSVGFLKQE
jgi:hypothetical protein